MLLRFLSPPAIYYLIVFVFIISLIIYRKRHNIKEEIKRWKPKEGSIGPFTFERRNENVDEKTKSASGIYFGEGSDFTDAKLNRIAGRDIIQQKRDKNFEHQEENTEVDFGKEVNFNNTEITDMAGRDLEK